MEEVFIRSQNSPTTIGQRRANTNYRKSYVNKKDRKRVEGGSVGSEQLAEKETRCDGVELEHPLKLIQAPL